MPTHPKRARGYGDSCPPAWSPGRGVCHPSRGHCRSSAERRAGARALARQRGEVDEPGHVGPLQQQHRVEIGAPDAGPEMQMRCGDVGMAMARSADRLTLRDLLAFGNRCRGDPGVGCSNPVRVIDADVQRPRHVARECHDASLGRAQNGAERRRDVNASMPGGVGIGRFDVAADDRPVDRPAIGPEGGRGGGKERDPPRTKDDRRRCSNPGCRGSGRAGRERSEDRRHRQGDQPVHAIAVRSIAPAP